MWLLPLHRCIVLNASCALSTFERCLLVLDYGTQGWPMFVSVEESEEKPQLCVKRFFFARCSSALVSAVEPSRFRRATPQRGPISGRRNRLLRSGFGADGRRFQSFQGMVMFVWYPRAGLSGRHFILVRSWNLKFPAPVCKCTRPSAKSSSIMIKPAWLSLSSTSTKCRLP